MTATDTKAEIIGEKWHRKMFDDKKGHQLRGHHHIANDSMTQIFNLPSVFFILSSDCLIFVLALFGSILNCSHPFQYHCMHSAFVWSYLLCSEEIYRQSAVSESVSVMFVHEIRTLGILFTFVNRLLTSIIKYFITPGSIWKRSRILQRLSNFGGLPKAEKVQWFLWLTHWSLTCSSVDRNLDSLWYITLKAAPKT